MWWIELIKEKDGIISLGGCKLGDTPSLFEANMGKYCCDTKKYDNNKVISYIDMDTMRIDNPIRDWDILDARLSCEYNERGIREISYYMHDYYEYPFETCANFNFFFDILEKSGRYKVEKPYVHPNYSFNITILENNNCILEYITSNPEIKSKSYFIKINLYSPKVSDNNIFDMEIAIQQEKRKYAYKQGKKIDQLYSYEIQEVLDKVNSERLRFYEDLWKDKIEKAYKDYKNNSTIWPLSLNESDWINIYKNAGMNEIDIEQYRLAKEPFMAALEDSSDMYRSDYGF